MITRKHFVIDLVHTRTIGPILSPKRLDFGSIQGPIGPIGSKAIILPGTFPALWTCLFGIIRSNIIYKQQPCIKESLLRTILGLGNLLGPFGPISAPFLNCTPTSSKWSISKKNINTYFFKAFSIRIRSCERMGISLQRTVFIFTRQVFCPIFRSKTVIFRSVSKPTESPSHQHEIKIRCPFELWLVLEPKSTRSL